MSTALLPAAILIDTFRVASRFHTLFARYKFNFFAQNIFYKWA